MALVTFTTAQSRVVAIRPEMVESVEQVFSDRWLVTMTANGRAHDILFDGDLVVFLNDLDSLKPVGTTIELIEAETPKATKAKK